MLGSVVLSVAAFHVIILVLVCCVSGFCGCGGV